MRGFISYYPGPSKLHPKVGAYMQQAVEKGYLSINHRSDVFVEKISKPTLQALRYKLNIPDEYTVVYTSSATEGWEIIAQSLIQKESLHITNGAFGERGFAYTQQLIPETQILQYDCQDVLPMDKVYAAEHIALTHCETSNATLLSNDILAEVRAKCPDSIISLDATSTLGGIDIPWHTVDAVFGSVQKCLGLPAGMGLMICSPKAIAKAKKINNTHYNSLSLMYDRMQDYQTTYTTNVLSIYLLGKVLEEDDHIRDKEKRLRDRLTFFQKQFMSSRDKQFLIKNFLLQSPTVIALAMPENIISTVKKSAQAQGLWLGNGYGKWAANTIRIANFPQHTEAEMKKALAFINGV